MDDELFIPYDPENEKLTSINEAAKPGKPASSEEPLKPQDIKDKTRISGNIPKIHNEKQLAQIEADVANIDKAFAMLNRPAKPDLNPSLIGRACGSYTDLVAELKAFGPLPDNVHIKFESATRRFLVWSGKCMKAAGERLDVLLTQEKNKDREKEINELSGIFSKLYRTEEYLWQNASELQLSTDIVESLKESIAEDRKFDEKLIHIATMKGYSLKDVDSAAKMAEEEGNEYKFVLHDVEQEKLLTTLKKKCADLLADLLQFYKDEVEVKVSLRDALTKMRLAEKKRDLAVIEKTYIRKLHDRKLRNKLKAEVIVLAYLLKNPTSLNSKRIDDVKSEINKIRWQMSPSAIS